MSKKEDYGLEVGFRSEGNTRLFSKINNVIAIPLHKFKI